MHEEDTKSLRIQPVSHEQVPLATVHRPTVSDTAHDNLSKEVVEARSYLDEFTVNSTPHRRSCDTHEECYNVTFLQDLDPWY